jgi:hypothetical protein
MGRFAETANVDYHLSFAGQGKQASIFCLQKTTEVCHFRIYMYIETGAAYI